ncbi:MAG TPA: MFS transporter [Planctomycetota bacterium]|nr:MFS transporter [Planctomycetota bacterium]
MRTRRSTAGLVAWAFYDFANSSFAAVIQTFVFAAYFTQAVAETPQRGEQQWGYAIAAAGGLVALGGPMLGAIADHTGRRKPWIAAFTLLCVASAALLWFVEPTPAHAGRAMLLLAVGVVGTEFAELFYNAMLPSLAPVERIGRWSGWAWGLGYLGGLLCLLLAYFGLIRPASQPDAPDGAVETAVRATCLLVAAWHLVFSLPLLLLTPDEPRTAVSWRAAVRLGLSQLADSVRHARRHGPLLRFLLARMLYADGLATLFAFGGIFAASAFGLDTEHVLLFGILLQITAGIGAAAFAWADDRIGGRATILLALGLLVPVTSAALAVRSETAFWILGAILGLFVGPVQAASRSYLARMAPAGLRNEMFGLFALSGRATAYVGPLLVGSLTAASGSSRVGLIVVPALLLAGLLLLRGVPRDAPGAAAGDEHAAT